MEKISFPSLFLVRCFIWYSKFSGIPSWVVGKTLKLLSERKTKDEKINSLEVQNDILNMEGSLLRQRRQRKSTNKLENKMVSSNKATPTVSCDPTGFLLNVPSHSVCFSISSCTVESCVTYSIVALLCFYSFMYTNGLC